MEVGFVRILPVHASCSEEPLCRFSEGKKFLTALFCTQPESTPLKDLLEIVETIRARGAGFRSLAEDIDTTTPAGRLVFHVFASIAQFERERIAERTKEGLQAAKARGRIGGRPPALSTTQKAEVRRMRDDEQRAVSEIARLFKVSERTVRRA